MKKQIRLICFALLFLLTININVLANEDTTIVDVSNISIGENVVHTHIYESKYDDTNHWTECLVCHDKQNVAKHTITTTWAMGYESCDKNNYATKTCDCGYKTTYRRPCVWTGKYYGTTEEYRHAKVCSVCDTTIDYLYYSGTYGKGTLYKQSSWEYCKNSSGTLITCKSGGTCATCKVTKTKNKHHFITGTNRNITCSKCNVNYGTYTLSTTSNGATPALWTTTVKVSLTNGATFNKSTSLRNVSSPFTSNTSTYTTNTAKTTATITYKSQFNSKLKTPYYTYGIFYINIGGVSSRVWTYSWNMPIETTKPTIDTITTNDITITNNDWVSSKEIIVNGTENYSNTVSIKVVDENNIVAYSGTTNVSNKKYSFEFIPKIEANELEKTYTISVTDANYNTTTKELKVTKVDKKEPTFVVVDSENMSQGNNNTITEKSDWSKSKTYDFYFKDDGIGNVSIGVNNYDDITLATYDETLGAYKRNYTFVGDAYTPVNCMVYAKDALGNLTTTTFVIDKIDNTAPTIENVEKELNVVEVLSASSEETTPNNETKETTTATLTITANDINEKLGLEGSGVTKYGVQFFTNGNDEIIWYDTNTIEITQNGTYYIYAQDLVGNVSTPMLLVVDDLTSDEDNIVNVYVTQASTFSVVIPKTIILSGETKNGEYQILVKGDIGGLDTISVTPDNILALQQLGKEDIIANVTQEKTLFNYNDGMTSDIPTTTNGTIIAPNMSAGSWKGQFNFNIKFSVIGLNNSIGSIKDDATSDNIIGQDQVQDKQTTYSYGVENKDVNNINN